MLEMRQQNFTVRQIAEAASIKVHTVKSWLAGSGNVRRNASVVA
jgi:hypothetical protein